MNKFDVPGEEYGTIEIARAVGKPNIPHLNRFVFNLCIHSDADPLSTFIY
jgi:RNA-dependent RNA polymerase